MGRQKRGGSGRTMANPRWQGIGWFFEPPEPISILELVNFGSLDVTLAGILMLMMEHKASVVVASGPSNAGKSTMLGALIDLLPPETEQIQLWSQVDDSRLLAETVPPNLYMVATEISSHGFYLWGHEAWKAFDILSRGCPLSGTMHAQTVRDVVDMLHQYLGLPLDLVANLDAVVTIRATQEWGEEPVRRVETVGLLAAEEEGLSIRIISSRSLDNGDLNFTDGREMQAALSKKFGIPENIIGQEIQLREQFLTNLMKEDRVSPEQVKEAVAEFYRSRP